VLNDPSLMLLVAGKQDPAAYKGFAGEQGVERQIVFAGPTDNPHAFYRAADFFILPTRHDPCSLVVLESLAMGVPVISTVFNGACEIMTDGLHGVVLPEADDIPAIATAMRRLIDPAFRNESSRACLALRPRLSFDTHMARLESIYRSAVRYGQAKPSARAS
jgi:glycosyltransferase involved in cell wall biosynthesis